MPRTCEHCSGPLPKRARRDSRYCSTRCRVAAWRDRRRPVPAELSARRRWVRHAANKAPLTTTGRAASSTDPSTWASHDQARTSTAGVGLGYVLAAGDGLACIDLDDCLSGGRLASWAANILRRLPATYIEVSPSGRGLHIWGRGRLKRGRRIRRPDGAKIEAYSQGRYITWTGRRWQGSPSRLADLSGALAALL